MRTEREVRRQLAAMKYMCDNVPPEMNVHGHLVQAGMLLALRWVTEGQDFEHLEMFESAMRGYDEHKSVN